MHWLIAGLALVVAAMYAFLAAYVVPRMARVAPDAPWKVYGMYGAGAFFLGAAATHIAVALHILGDQEHLSGHVTVHLLPHLAQAIGGALFIHAAVKRLDVRIASVEQTKAELENERLREQVMRNERQQSLGQLAGSVAHDFNNLLGVILSFGQFVKERVDDPVVVEDVEQIIQAAERGALLTQQLVQFSRRQAQEKEVVELAESVRLLEPFLQRVLAPDVSLALRFGEDLPPIRLGRGHVAQILVNLVVNSRDALPEGGTVTISCEGCRSDEGRFAKITVLDDGTGMPAGVAERALDPFFTTKDAGSGAGFGLATVNAAVRAAGGRVTIDSTPGHGTAVVLDVPAAEEQPAAEEPAPAPRSMVGLRVLVVEDDATLRDGIIRMLDDAVEVRAASDAPDALQLLKAGGEVDVLVTDLTMPGMSGAQLVAHVRESLPAVGVVCMSGWAGGDDLHAQVPSDAVLLDKPFNKAALLTAIREAAGRAE